MTQTLIQDQIRTIQKATENAAKSKEAALQFLKEAGIVKREPTSAVNRDDKKKK
ncbi:MULTISPECIES: hypothetical protein [Terrimonas]|uniref:hypothetical protein n=1 Tax=Terrimonas TaxID=296051 RepID=UPI0023ED5251|nr:hypothetical protein [Terrimonas sp. H1YJ31]